MKTRSYVWITTIFPATHRWIGAPIECGDLRNWHRHLFHVRLHKEVFHNDRDIEFLTLKKNVEDYIAKTYKDKSFEFSCEQIAEDLLNVFDANMVLVSEDNENGATVQRVQEQTGFLSFLNDTYSTANILKTKVKEDTESLNKELESLKEISAKPLPHETIKAKCFIGLEAEGPNRGQKTIFIPGSFNSLQVENSFKKVEAEIDPGTLIYYGAGNDLFLNKLTLDYLLSRFSARQITVEVPSHNWMKTADLLEVLQNVPVTIVSREPADLQYSENIVSYVKTFTLDSVYWISRTYPYVYKTSLTDPLFDKDKDIE